ncbi:tRNA uracil 4-sulfurtransferase ThiI [Methanocaldococcus infernus]
MDILVRYGEIGLKSNVIRKKLEEILRKNIIKSLRRYEIDAEVEILHRRLLVKVNKDEEKALELLGKTPGIVSYSPVYICNLDINEIVSLALQVMRKKLKEIKKEDVKFAVKTKRSNKKFPYNSVEVNEIVGEKIIEKFNLKVDLEEPDVVLGIEISDKVYIFTETYKGVGGLPVGSQGRAVCLVSDGIDSPVAAFMMIKRGCRGVILHLKITEEALNKVRKIVEVLNDYDPELEFVVYDYKKELEEIKERLKSIKKEEYTCIFCKKKMLKIAEKYAKYLNCDAIVTGDNLGQVASQTLKNLRVISSSIEFPILRPLIGFDKNEIVEIAKSIGTYNISIEKEIKCPYLPRFPKTICKLEEVKKVQEKANIKI